jgi:DNA-directed RNA polymerase subunit RPC12/RpoP
MKATAHKPTNCPRCGYRVEMATGLGHRKRPRPGDFSLCLRCGQLLRFDHEFEPVMAFERELEQLSDRQRALIARARAELPKLWGNRKK